jgi:hypothetical protein
MVGGVTVSYMTNLNAPARRRDSGALGWENEHVSFLAVPIQNVNRCNAKTLNDMGLRKIFIPSLPTSVHFGTDRMKIKRHDGSRRASTGRPHELM